MKYKVLDILAKGLSALCYPLWIPTFGMVLFCAAFVGRKAIVPTVFWWVACGGTFVFTALIPLSLILLMIRKGQIKDIYITSSQERVVPYIYTIAGFGFWSYFVAAVLNAPAFLLWTALGATLALVVVTIINHWWKISAHLCAMGGLLGGICSYALCYGILPFGTVCAVLGVSLLLMYARLYVGAHTPLQVVVGYLVGLLCTFIPNYIIYV